MANPSQPFGLRLARGAEADLQMVSDIFYVPATDSTALFIGDPVVTVTGAGSTDGYCTITQATAGATCVGVVMGFDVVLAQGGISSGNTTITPNLNITYRPASTAMYVYVCTDPTAIWEVMSSGNFVSANMGKNANFTFATAGSTTFGTSGVQLDETSIATTNTLQVHILGKANIPNNAFGTNAIARVKFNTHQYAYGTAGV